MDTVTPSKRSFIMSRIRAKDTKPEIVVRKKLFESGLRYRIHVKDLPGTPDIAIKKYKIVVDVRGCFWHGHGKCKFSSKPKSNKSFWLEKIDRNKQSDRANLIELRKMGYRVFVVWECKTKEEGSLTSEIKKIQKYLSKEKLRIQ